MFDRCSSCARSSALQPHSRTFPTNSHCLIFPHHYLLCSVQYTTTTSSNSFSSRLFLLPLRLLCDAFACQHPIVVLISLLFSFHPFVASAFPFRRVGCVRHERLPCQQTVQPERQQWRRPTILSDLHTYPHIPLPHFPLPDCRFRSFLSRAAWTASTSVSASASTTTNTDCFQCIASPAAPACGCSARPVVSTKLCRQLVPIAV